MTDSIPKNLPSASSIRMTHTEIAYKGRVFNLYRETIALPSGVSTTLDVIKHPGAAAIVPFLDDRTVLLLYQYRHAVGQFMWEIPAGTLEAEETPYACAQRELAEETGYRAGRYQPLGAFTPVPGYSDECIQLYSAHDLFPAKQNLDSDEVLEVHPISLEGALEMIRNGDIHDGKTICGLLKACRSR